MGILGFPDSPKRCKDQRNVFVFLSVAVIFAPILSSPFSFQIGPVIIAVPTIFNTSAHAASVPGNINADQRVNLQDFAIFSSYWMDPNCIDPTWCGGSDINHDQVVDILDLVVLMDNWLLPETTLLTVQNDITSPTRLAAGPGDTFYVTDSRTCSVFICDPNMDVIGELRGLDRPLGIAVNSAGDFYVGNDGRNNVEFFSANGTKIRRIGEGVIQMPNDIKIGPDNNLYICDSQSDLIRVYDPNGTAVRVIGQGQLNFPSTIEIATVETSPGVFSTELFVAEKHYQIQVFDLEGNFLRSFGEMVRLGGSLGTTWKWKGKFVNLQSLMVDDLGRLHALDSFLKKVQILNPQTGVYISDYGQGGTAPGQLNTPSDIAMDNNGNVAVANTGNARVEIIYTVP